MLWIDSEMRQVRIEGREIVMKNGQELAKGGKQASR